MDKMLILLNKVIENIVTRGIPKNKTSFSAKFAKQEKPKPLDKKCNFETCTFSLLLHSKIYKFQFVPIVTQVSFFLDLAILSIPRYVLIV